MTMDEGAVAAASAARTMAYWQPQRRPAQGKHKPAAGRRLDQNDDKDAQARLFQFFRPEKLPRAKGDEGQGDICQEIRPLDDLAGNQG